MSPRRTSQITVAVALAAALLATPSSPASGEPAGAPVPWDRMLASRVDAGMDHTCVIINNGSVRCWGEGDAGRLGYGNTDDIGDNENPADAGAVDLGAGRTATDIAAGAAHTCAVLDDGNVRCWGDDGFGQVGYGNNVDIGDDETPGSAGPVNLALGRTATAITAGTQYSCALLDRGDVRCWGTSPSGNGFAYHPPGWVDPTPGDIGDITLGRDATAVTGGAEHICAILDDGTLRCWGNGDDGRLGYGNEDVIGDDESPGDGGPVDLGAGRTATAVTAGDGHTCAILDDGTVRCWGEGDYGRLGYGDTDDIGDNETPGSVGPVDLGAGRTAIAIAAAGKHTCAVLDDASVRCWGWNNVGQLGYGDTVNIGDDESPAAAGPVDISSRGVTAITASDYHACAVLDTGRVRCWGAGSQGQLGYGNTVTIGDDETPRAAGSVVAGGVITLFVVITP